MKLALSLTLLLLCLSVKWGFAQVDSPGPASPAPLILTRPLQEVDATQGFEVLEDSTDRLGFEAIEHSQEFKPISEISFPFPLGHRMWARATLINPYDFDQRVFFYTNSTDSVAVYLFTKNGIDSVQTGNYVSWRARSTYFGNPVGVSITIPAQDTAALYVLMRELAGVGPNFRPRFYDSYLWFTSYFSRSYVSTLIIGLFLGGLAIMLGYNLVLFFSVRIKTYLFYALYLFSIIISLHFEVVVREFAVLSFSNYQLNRLIILIGLNGASMFYLLFGRSFMDTPRLTPVWDKILLGMVGFRILIILAGAVAFLVFDEPIFTQFGIFWYGVEGLIILVYFYWLIKARSQVAWFFIAGSVLIFGGGFAPVFMANIMNVPFNVPNFLLTSILLEILVFSLGLGYKMRKQQEDKLEAEQKLNRELQKVNTAFGRFVPHEFIQSLGHESVLDVQLGDQVEKEVTVLFADIRKYTTLAEQMTPGENFRFLNAYLGRMGPLIQAHQGFVNQYYGDGIMALFMSGADDALKAAIGMSMVLKQYNREREVKGRMPIKIGIGIHSGPLMMGIIGDTLRLEAGVVSDTVNTASRMEGLTKHFGVQILLSETTQGQLSEGEFHLRPLGKVRVKGRQQATMVWECYDTDQPDVLRTKDSQRADYSAVLEAYWSANFAETLRQLEPLLEVSPKDPVLNYYQQLAKQYLTEGPPEAWNGVEYIPG
ncbi:MAG: adenylate/guanylate cyclase domain-containing protein [Bacteroidota bacterium]